jgi:putative Ca2+/H+ antiporter (TMEM165/GDT1 family)
MRLGALGNRPSTAPCACIVPPPPRPAALLARRAAAPAARRLPASRSVSAAAATAAAAAAASGASPASSDEAGGRDGGRRNLALTAGAAAALGGAAWAAYATGAAAPAVAAARQVLSSSALARSGFFAAFSLIFASEIGDKTFFIAALLAMRLGRWVSFVGSVAALTLMTAVSVGIGFAVKSVPAVVRHGEVLGQWLGAALLAYFGVRTLREAFAADGEAGSGDELGEAQVSVQEAARGGLRGQSPWQAIAEVGSLIFVAEWGDRSMLATIALGAAQNPLGVAAGAVAGHVVATAIAVLGGGALSGYVNERTVGFIGGSLFLLFAVATIAGVF